VVVALLVELGLHRVKESTIEDGGLLAGQYLALEDDLANVEPIAQKMGERAAGERVCPLFVSALTNFGMPADAWTANLSSTGLQQSVKCWRK
jgi:hypothetical protein